MADYIDKNILCQAYIHVELPAGLDEAQLQAIKDHLMDYANSRAKFFVYPEVQVDVEFKEGSLKTYITVAGFIYAAVIGYGGFRTGIDYLHTDVKRLADSMVAESLFTTKARHQHILRTEARTGVIGSLKVLMDDMTVLETSLGQISVDEAARRIGKIKDDADALLINVRADEDAKSIQNEVDEFSEKLPEKCPHDPQKPPSDSAIVAYYDALSELRKNYGKKKKGFSGMPPRRHKKIH